MITTSDREYKETKCLKEGKGNLEAPFDELARWIASSWQVAVLNVIYDCRNSLHGPRLQIVLEHPRDVAIFRSGLNYLPEQQLAIKTKFMDIVGRDQPCHYEGDDLFVIFWAFAPLAAEEADSRISALELNALKVRIGNPHLWEISRCFGNVTFFFYTDA